jgi:aquaporin Z
MTFPDAPRPAEPTRAGRWAAETAGTFVLVFGLIGTATFSAVHVSGDATPAAVGILGIAAALGISVVVGAYAFGPVSGGHFNPAVSVGLAVAGRMRWREVPGYVVAQLVGGVLGAACVLGIAAGGPPGTVRDLVATGFASNGFGDRSPSGASMASAVLVEVVGTAVFVFVILGVTNARAHPSVAPIPIGITLTLLLLVAIPVDNAGFNPARSLATAVFAGGPWIAQLWLFVVAPLVGATVAGATNRVLFETAAPVAAPQPVRR